MVTVSEGDTDEVQEISQRTEEIHRSELAAALEQYRGEEIDGSIVAAQMPAERIGYVELTWGTSEVRD